MAGTGGIASSIAIKFDLYDDGGEGADSTGYVSQGAVPTTANSVSLSTSGLDLHDGDLFKVSLTYDGTTLTETIQDVGDSNSTTLTYPLNIPAVVGASTAYIGFTGGTGAVTATQQILSWAYAPTVAVSPNAPTSLGVTPASATSVYLTWTNNATNQSGYHLDRATDAGFTQNLITENLPANPSSYLDIATGLAPGGTYYYRLRATNSAGDSSNTNVASVTIPIAPPKPSNQAITNVTSSEIDITWQDNAGHQADGYKIIRA